MTYKIKLSELKPFDAADHLEDEQAIAEYLTAILEEDDPALFTAALADVARAKGGITEVARLSGLSSEVLYHTLQPDIKPKFETISRICTALGIRLVAQPNHL